MNQRGDPRELDRMILAVEKIVQRRANAAPRAADEQAA